MGKHTNNNEVEKNIKNICERKKSKVLSIISIILIISGALTVFSTTNLFKSSIYKVTCIGLVRRNKEVSIESNHQLQEGLRNWGTMSETEKEDLVKQIAEAEFYSLGTPYKVQISLKQLDENILGQTVSTRIAIDREHLKDNAWYVVRTIAHESRHVYQQACLDPRANWHPLFMDMNEPIDKWSILSNRYYYHQKGENYMNQPIEKDAFQYGQSRANYYRILLGK